MLSFMSLGVLGEQAKSLVSYLHMRIDSFREFSIHA